MPLPALIQRLLRRAPPVEGPQEGKTAADPGRSPDDLVAAARTQARRRVIGAAVLLAAAVLVFSLVFESRPRPLPLDTPIEIAGRQAGSASVAAPAVKPVTPQPASAASAPPQVASPVPAPVEPVAAEPAAASAPAAAAPPPSAVKATPQAKAGAAAGAESAAPAKGVDVSKGAAAAPEKTASRPAAADSRFVVQVGAFADMAQVRALRSRLDKLGLPKHYVQATDSKGGQRVNRVRLGPYATRDEADRAAARLKEAGLPGQVFEL
jgi:DedD protein